MKKIIAIITTLIILMIPLCINAYELETENGKYEYSNTIPETGYDYSHTICNGTKLKKDNTIFNNSKIDIKGLIEGSNCKIYFNKNGEEITKNYEVKIEVKNGKTNEESKIVKEGENAEFTLTNDTGYSNPKVTCTNNQTGTIQNNTLTVTNVTNDTTCTVEYTANTYEVKYNSNGGTGTMQNSTHTYGTAKALSTNTFAREGYTFLGWSTDKDSKEVKYQDKENIINLTSNNNEIINLYAVWSINSYTVSVVVQNGTITGETSKDVDYNTNATFTLNPNNGYGNPTVSCTNSQNGSISGTTLTISNVTDDTTCTVTYKENEYTIEYNLNGGTVTGNPNSYTVNTDTITLKNPSKTGYTFTGWTGSNGSVAQTTVTIPKGSTGNKSYTANYKINTYTVNVTVTNGTITGSTSKTVNHGSSTTFTVNPSSGYGSPTITCTNSQKGSLNASTLTVSSVTNGTTCTVAFKQLTASEYIVEQKDDYSDSDIIKISQPSTVQTPALTEYRYSGSDVDNYVTFNNETWRIIGVFQVDNGSGTYEERIKLIRDDSIGNYSWDTSASTINSGYGINQWGVTGSYNGADLMKLLNTGPYYNRTSGTCYAGKNNATKSCSFTTTGLNSTAKNMIGDAKWYTAASNFEDVTSKVSYEEERGNVVGETDTGISMTKRTNWIGSIGLIYPSDYGYASSGCGNGEYVLFEYDNSTCKSTNWLSDNISQYLLAPATGGADRVRYISSEGYVGRTITHNGYGVRPSVYLLSSVKITGGNGTSSDPYELSL